jgi:hypothetical protein
MFFVLIATAIFIGTCSLALGRVLTGFGTLACAAIGGVVLLFGLASMHWHMNWTDFGVLAITATGVAAALSMHRSRMIARNRAFA